MTDSDDQPAAGRAVKALFVEASDLPSDARGAFLDERCAGDATLRSAVESLLAAHDRATGFLVDPTLAPAATNTIAPLIAPPDPQPRRIGHYRLLKELGEGGFGTVWLAEQTHPVRRQVALKVIKPGMDTKQVIARFEAERQALAILDHANIARVYDAGETDQGRPYFVMELVNGVPITKFCDDQKYDVRRRLELFVQVCQAVQHAHTKGIIHRDIKPSNVLAYRSEDGPPVIKVIDFGIAKATQQRLTEKTVFTEQRQMIGTPEYMPPEQAEMGAVDIDTRSDVYGLGVLMYELLTGVTPFDARELRSKAFVEMQRVIREVDPLAPSTRLGRLESRGAMASARATEPSKLRKSLRGELDWIVMKCLEKDRARRYETANGLAADVLNYLSDQPVLAGPTSAAYRARKFFRRHRAGAALTTAALVIAAVVAGLYVRGIRAEQAKTRAALADAQEQRRLAEERTIEAEQANLNTQAVNNFLTTDLLASADPEVAQGRTISVQEAVDTASAKVHERFADHPQIEAAVRMSLANTYNNLGKAEVALEHAKEAWSIRKKELGEDRLETLRALNLIGMVYFTLGRRDESEVAWRQAVERGRRSLGPEHPDTLTWSFNLAQLVQGQGKWRDAEQLYGDILKVWKKQLGDDDVRTVTAVGYLGSVLTDEGRLDEAEPLVIDAWQRRRRLYGDDHPHTMHSLNDVAMLRQKQGRLDEAEGLFREALERHKKVFGPDHPSTLAQMNNMATIYFSRGNFAQAEVMAREAFELCRASRGIDHPITLSLLHNVANAQFKQHKLAEAESGFRELFEHSGKSLGEDNRQTVLAAWLLGQALAEQGRYADAEPILARAYAKGAAAGFSDDEVRVAAGHYGLALFKLGRYADAEKPLREATQVRADGASSAPDSQPTSRPDDPLDRDVLEALADVCDRTGRLDEAERFRRQAAALPQPTTKP